MTLLQRTTTQGYILLDKNPRVVVHREMSVPQKIHLRMLKLRLPTGVTRLFGCGRCRSGLLRSAATEPLAWMTELDG